MKNSQLITYKIKQTVLDTLNEVFPDLEASMEDIKLDYPPKAEFGDFSTNIALRYAKNLGKNPREIATILSESLATSENIDRVEVAGPGFINLFLDSKFVLEYLGEMDLEQAEMFEDGAGAQVMVEYGQPNTHKAFHVGHLKSAITGLAIANLWKSAGYKVVHANYFGDVGLHVAKCLWGYKNLEKPEGFDEFDAHGKMEFIDSCYVYGSKKYKEDEDAKAEIKALNKEIYTERSAELEQMYQETREWSVEHQMQVFADLGVHYDVQYPESITFKLGQNIVEKYKDDVFVKSEGAYVYEPENIPGKPQIPTFVFLSGEGLPTYSAKDLGLAYKKFEDFDLSKSIYLTSVEQTDYFRSVFSALGKIDNKFEGKLKHVPFGWLLVNNKKASSRTGEMQKGYNIILQARKLSSELISENKEYTEQEKKEISEAVAMAGLKFMILSHEIHQDINYDPESFIKLTGFSGPYILYTFARSNGIARKASEMGESDVANVGELLAKDFSPLADGEKSLALALSKFPDVLQRAFADQTLHGLCNYLYNLAQTYSQFYTNFPILEATENKKIRIFLNNQTAKTIKFGLEILGISTIKKM